MFLQCSKLTHKSSEVNNNTVKRDTPIFTFPLQDILFGWNVAKLLVSQTLPVLSKLLQCCE